MPSDSTPSSFVTSTRTAANLTGSSDAPLRRAGRRGVTLAGPVTLVIAGTRHSGPRSPMATVVVVGGGVLGTMHAYAARDRGHTVVQLEADLEARKASVRNFGLVWVSGRAPGAELASALRARELWEVIAARGPRRRVPSRRVAHRRAAPRRARGAGGGRGRAPRRSRAGFRLLEPAEVPTVNPVVRGSVLGALHLHPGRGRRAAAGAARRCAAAMEARGGYTFVGGRTAIVAEPGLVRDHTGAEWRGDLVILCPGAAHAGVAARWLADAPLRRCRLQMMQTEPLGERLTTSIADGDSLRYYPAFAVPAGGCAPGPGAGGVRHGARSCSSRSGPMASSPIGDTHVYDEPYDFAVEDEPYDHLPARAESILGRALPPVQRRWAGVYSQATDTSACVRVQPEPGLVVVTGPGGRGMTLSPAIAAETFEGAGW